MNAPARLPRSEPEPAARPRERGEAVAIVAALAEEVSGLRSLLANSRRLPQERGRAWSGTIDGVSVILACTGVGASNAARGARELLARHAVRRLIVVGVSGALAPSLLPGGILVGREVVDGDEPVPSPDRSWVERILELHGGIAATLLASPVILTTPEAKARAYAALPAGAPAAVDLETASFAREAAARGVSYVAVRVVSDTASESLPLDFNLLRDRSGGVDRLRVAAAAAVRPSSIVHLWRLRGRMALCSRGLARFVRGILAGVRA